LDINEFGDKIMKMITSLRSVASAATLALAASGLAA